MAAPQHILSSQLSSSFQSASSNGNTAEWRHKLTMLLDDESVQELISREKKDRCDFEQIAALASKMGLYSHKYAKVVVFSKVPLSNYRHDLDDRRPLREVNLPITMLRRVDAYVKEYLAQKSRRTESFPDLSFSISSINNSIGTEEGLFEKPEPPASTNKVVAEKILWQRSLQMRDQQQAWQESPKGRRMLEFRKSLPAYKEKEAILSTIARNQGFTYPVRTHFLENILEMSGYRLTPENQIDDYGQERIWKMNKQAPRKRKSQIASVVEGLIFEEPEDGVQKVVIATNIAETSITINDVVFVLDCGKAKESSYDALNNTPCLLPTWISKVSTQQRRGRAGRVQPGECYRLYPRCVYDAFAEYQLPEILRTPLQSLCLQIKSLKLGSISEFLSKALQSPEILAVQNAIEYLKIIGAFDDNENLSILGHYLAMLPMEPKLGKMLILGAIFNCLDPILTVAAGLSVRDPFLTPLDKKDLAEAAKSQFSHDNSDHLALVRAYDGWKDAEIDLIGHEYCWTNFLSVQSMKTIDALRMEFLTLLKDIGLVDSKTTNCNAWSYDVHLLRAVICYGLYPGICSVVHNEKTFSLKTMEDGQVHLHANSVNARESKIPYPWLVFNEKMKVNSVFLRDSTAVSDSIVLLFGGSISKDGDGHLKMLGGYLEFFMRPAVADMFRSIRTQLDEFIQSKLLFPMMGMHSFHELLSAVRLLISDDKCEGRFIYGCHVLKPSKPSVMTLQPALVSRSESGPGGDNSKGQLQTVLTRAGHAAPIYKTMQLKNNQFQAAVEFNGMQIMGQPCNNKKSAEKDAAALALQWLMRRTQTKT